MPKLRRVLVAWLVVLGLLCLSGPATRASDNGLAGPLAPHAPGELLVGLVKTPTRATRDQYIATLVGDVQAEVVDRIDALGIVHLRLPSDRLVAVMSKLRSDPRVDWVEPNYLLHLDFTPNDPLYATHQTSYLNPLQVEKAWDVTTGRQDVVVAVLDTGVNIHHPDLQAGIWTNPGEIPDNGVDDDGNGFVDDVHGWDFADDDNDPSDDHGHGTHVSGIIAARINNALGIAGMAGGVTIMPVDVFHGGIGTYADLIQAIVYATDNGANVVNMSLGALSYSRGEEAAVEYAWERNVLLVAAAGNNGSDALHYPAAHAHVIGVAATDGADQRVGFSNYGPFVSVSAPGLSVISTYRDGGYRYMSGTSMATPHVSGLAALILSRNPTLSNAQVRSIIESTADDLGTPGWDPYFGYGRINAARALAAVPVPPTPSPTPEPPLPPRPIWPEGCVDVLQDGSFDAPGAAAWHLEGEAAIVDHGALSGTLHLAGVDGASGMAWQVVHIPYTTTAATLAFAFRIDNQDFGLSGNPREPSRDRLRVSFQDATGRPLISLLRTGNAADTVPDGLPWDEYLYSLMPQDLVLLRQAGDVRLTFYGDNDANGRPTDFYIDTVRLCVQAKPLSQWPYLRFVIVP
ncbi:MAG: S8 family serine peptidase [Anaerolineae bacterium]|nr:S8 family serine peptidase [Anaerolineae bacterium]